jgi:predicted nuclease of predicted toxin-antitoxin system
MKILIDANISWRVKKLLNFNGIEIFHVLDFFKNDEKDFVIWEYALNNNMCILTNDSYFLNFLAIKGFPPKIILLKTGNQTTYNISQLLNKSFQEINSLLYDNIAGAIEINNFQFKA